MDAGSSTEIAGNPATSIPNPATARSPQPAEGDPGRTARGERGSRRTSRVTGGVRRADLGAAQDHADGVSSVVEGHIVDQLADEKQPSSVGSADAFGKRGIGNRRG